MMLSASEAQELRQNPLFHALSEAQLLELQEGISLRTLAQGEHLFESGTHAGEFYLVRSGQIKLYRLAPTGQEKVIEIVRPRQSFAEAVMFLDIPSYPVNAQALGDSELFVINNHAFMKLLSQSVETCFQVMADISVRLKRHLIEIDSLTLQNATLRVVNYLGYLLPEGAAQSATITLPAAKNIIASRLSITPETLSRILHMLSSKGVIAVEGLQIRVLDVERLRACS